MASLRLKYNDRSRSPPQRDNVENRNMLNGQGGRRGVGHPSNNQLLEQVRKGDQTADLSALQARREIEHK